MAISIDGQNVGNVVDSPEKVNPAAANIGVSANPNKYGSSLSFSSNNLHLMSMNQGSDYTNNISDAIKEVFKRANTKFTPVITVLDKESTANIAYSAIVVSLQKGNVVSYFTILLEGTGRKPLTAGEVAAEWQTAIKVPNSNITVYTTDDAFDNILFGQITSALAVNYGNNVSYVSVDGLILRHAHMDIKLLAQFLAATAYNACAVKHELWESEEDINIQGFLAENKDKTLKIDSTISKAAMKNEIGYPVRCDWLLSLNLIDNKPMVQSINLQNNKINLAMVGGFIDAIPEVINVPSALGMAGAVTQQIRLHPNIVITSTSLNKPTLGNLLLGIATSATMLNPNMWLAPLRLMEGKTGYGSLNLFTNLENAQNGVGAKYVLDPKKYSVEEIQNILKNMFTLAPVLSMDIESYGANTFISSAFPAGAKGKADANKTAACQLIVKTINWLTSGAFPADFPINEIFNSEGIVIPLGTWNDNKAERDIREIDLAFLASHTDDMNLLNRWITSNVPMSSSGVDPFMTKVDIISKVVPSAEISGKAVRVTFTHKFMSTLMSAVQSSGLTARYEPEVKYMENNNISIMSSFLANAGLSNVNGFGYEAIQSGPNYRTAYTSAGYGIR